MAAPKVSNRINGYQSVSKVANLSKRKAYDVQPNICPNEHSDRRDA